MAGYRYELTDLVGEGGMGAVYVAYDRLQRQRVALKQLQQLEAEAAEGLALALAREFRTLAGLHHPYIVRVLDYGFGQDYQPFYTMSLLAESQTIVEACAADEANRVQYIFQVWQALRYLHQQGIVHRDLKPDNILVVEGEVRIVDFGLALDTVYDDGEGKLAGTLAYMAPELFFEGSKPSFSSDMYAVGVIIYQILTGRVPFGGDDVGAVMDMIVDAPVDWTGVAEGWRSVLARLLAKWPAERYGTIEEVMVAIGAVTGAEPPAETAAIRESFLQSARFVGREEELNQLLEGMDGIFEGRGSSWLVGGESGVGKSRLMDELRTQALIEGVFVIRGQSAAQGGAYQVWRPIWRHLLLTTALSDEDASILKLYLDDVDELLGREVPSPPPLAPQLAQKYLFRIVTDMFRRQRQPVLVILEDLHWMESSSLALLHHLNQVVSQLPLLVVANYRHDERPDLVDILPDSQTLLLERLGKRGIVELVRSMVGEVAHEERMIAWLERETEGNPFFLVEVVRALAEARGELGQIDGAALPEHILTGGIQAVVAGRLGRVSVVARAALERAAVIGRVIDVAFVEGFLAEGGEISLEEWLIQGANAAILEVHEEAWQFAHDKLRTSLLAGIGEERWVAVHKEVGLLLEVTHEGERSYAPLLARVWGEVGDMAKERMYSVLAAEEGMAHYAHEEALYYWERVLALTEEDDREARFEILLQMELVYEAWSKPELQAEILAKLMELAKLVDSDVCWAKLLLRRAYYARMMGELDEAITMAMEAERQGVLAGLIEVACEGAFLQGRLLRIQHQFDESEQILRRAAEVAEEEGFQKITADCWLDLGGVYFRWDKYEVAFTYFTKAQMIYKEIGDRQGEAGSLFNLGLIAERQKRFTDCISLYLEVLTICKAIDYLFGQIFAVNNLAVVYMDTGDFERALQEFDKLLVVVRENGYRVEEGLILTNLVMTYVGLERYELAMQKGEEALVIWEQSNNKGQIDFVNTYLGHALVGLERWEEARERYQTALEGRRERDEHQDGVDNLAGLAWVAWQMGDVLKAKGCVEELLLWVAEHGVTGVEYPVMVYWRMYEILRGMGDERAEDVLVEGYEHLQKEVENIEDEEIRRKFLENVAANRAVMAAWGERVR
ncbi:MAG TPA: tetratricopeptide repeat protein [Anaerolineae bacterium]|nr:tetratricopeptide repeat protein [Anaerolineae bacterium]